MADREEMMVVAEPPLEPGAVMAGFHETFRRLGLNTELLLQMAAQTWAIAEVLVARGLVGLDELEDRRRSLEERLRSTAGADHVVQLAAEVDKYAEGTPGVEIDCQSRLPLCHAACCRLRFALTPQDVGEGVVQWELGRPYLNRQRADGFCVHCDEDSHGCQVYQNRPAVCRSYDCRADTRIWSDFEGRVPSPELVGLFPNARPG